MARSAVARPGSDRQDTSRAVRQERRVVGVVGDVRHLALEQASGNEMYLPLRQCGDLPVCGPGGALDAAGRRRSRRRCARRCKPHRAEPCRQRVPHAAADRGQVGLAAALHWCCCSAASRVFALVLASLGIYALISYSVSQRTQEIGIRMALGASARDVQARIVGQTLRLAAIGMVIGAGASWLLAAGCRGCCSASPPAIRRRSSACSPC